MHRLQLGLAHRPHALDPIAEEPQGQARRVDVAGHRRTATLHAAELHLADLAEPPGEELGLGQRPQNRDRGQRRAVRIGEPDQRAGVRARQRQRLVDKGRHPLFQPRPRKFQMVAAVAIAVGDEDQIDIVADRRKVVADFGLVGKDRGQTLGGSAVLVPDPSQPESLDEIDGHLPRIGVVSVEVEVRPAVLPRIAPGPVRRQGLLQPQRVVAGAEGGVVGAVGVATDQADADRIAHRPLGEWTSLCAL